TWGREGPLVGKVVLFGGAYRAARDQHTTSIGPLSGVQILAQAIESDLNGRGIRELNEIVAFSLDIALGVLLAWVHHRLEGRAALALWASLGAMPILCLSASLIAFNTLALCFNFVPVVVSVLIHQLYEMGHGLSHPERSLSAEAPVRRRRKASAERL